MNSGVYRAPSEQRDCRRIVGADSGKRPVESLRMHEPRDGSPCAAHHVADCIDGEDTATSGRIDDGVQCTLRPCEVECQGADDNGLV